MRCRTAVLIEKNITDEVLHLAAASNSMGPPMSLGVLGRYGQWLIKMGGICPGTFCESVFVASQLKASSRDSVPLARCLRKPCGESLRVVTYDFGALDALWYVTYRYRFATRFFLLKHLH